MPAVILVTNDDGVHAAGLHALAAALDNLGDVYVVAPDREQSAVGRDHVHIAQLVQGRGEGGQARGMDAVVIGDENHRRHHRSPIREQKNGRSEDLPLSLT